MFSIFIALSVTVHKGPIENYSKMCLRSMQFHAPCNICYYVLYLVFKNNIFWQVSGP